MAYPPPTRYGYSHSRNDADDHTGAPQYFADPDSTLLEPALLNADTMQHPDANQLRKATFVNNSESHHWNPQYAGGTLSIAPASTGSAPYHDDNHPMPPPFGHAPQSQAWPFESGSGHCTPTNRMDFEHPPLIPGRSEQTHYVHQRSDSARGSFSHPIQQPGYNAPPEESYHSAQLVQTPMSPHSHHDWMVMAAQESESKPNRGRLQGQSPPVPTIDFQRRDGIRKKNARIDIPPERSIANIEQLLESTHDEEIVRELKQQKRLLRNREAALASRQRKKKHTEDLEQKEKDFNRSIETYIRQIDALAHDRDTARHNCNMLFQRCEELRRTNELLEQEKSDLKRVHDGETAVLRKRIHALEDDMQHGLAPAISAAPSSTGFADFNAGMESLSMGAYEWEDLLSASDLQNDLLDESQGFELKPEQSCSLPTPIEPSILPSGAAASKPSTESTPDQTVTSGLLFFLLLCGAFVASKPPTSEPSDLPQVPADVRAAAPIVLNNLLNDVQPSASTVSFRAAHVVDAAEPAASAPHNTGAEAQSRLDRMHHRLTAPTRQQQLDSAFSLTTQEYASIANFDYAVVEEGRSSSRHRRTIAEALQSAQAGASGKSDVDLRSLLMQQIPEDVVRQFRELVRDHEEIETRQRQDHDEMTEFKSEI